jgi:hypothetical protein
MSSGTSVFADRQSTLESHQELKHDRDLPASSCSRFVTSYHPISHRHGTLRGILTTLIEVLPQVSDRVL